MKTIKVFPPLNPDESDLSGLPADWQNGIKVKKVTECKDLLDYINVLLINFWHSMVAESGKLRFCEFRGPQIKMQEDGENTILSWSITILEEDKPEEDKPEEEK
jgi:hypothetical protein